MTGIKDTTWNKDPHTDKKLVILLNHLQAWVPIMGRYFKKVRYIDGFAGAGEYCEDSNTTSIIGNRGSPLVALDVISGRCNAQNYKANFTLDFVEARKDRREHLSNLLTKRYPKLPDNITYKTHHAKFTDFIFKQKLEPTFAFLDPFGYSGNDLPLKSISHIMSHNNCEVLITLMDSFAGRFLEDDDKKNSINKLLDTTEWQKISTDSLSERIEAILALYKNQLKTVCDAKYVWSFKMVDQNNNEKYDLVFATKSLKGIIEMKRAMWKATADGKFKYSGREGDQLRLENFCSNKELIKQGANTIHNQFVGQTVTCLEVQKFAWGEMDTIFKKRMLDYLEKQRKIIKCGINIRGWPDGCKIRFEEPWF